MNFGVHQPVLTTKSDLSLPLTPFLGSLSPSLCTLEGFEETADTFWGSLSSPEVVIQMGNQWEEHTLQALVAPEMLWPLGLGSGDRHKLSGDLSTWELLPRPSLDCWYQTKHLRTRDLGRDNTFSYQKGVCGARFLLGPRHVPGRTVAMNRIPSHSVPVFCSREGLRGLEGCGPSQCCCPSTPLTHSLVNVPSLSPDVASSDHPCISQQSHV